MMQRLDTRTLEDLTGIRNQPNLRTTGNTLQFEIRRRPILDSEDQVVRTDVRVPVIFNDRFLTADTNIETEQGNMILMDFWVSEHQKLRCQSTFRASNSWNGILGLHDDFTPFLFDNGTRIKYVLPEVERQRLISEAWIGRLSNMTNDDVWEHWTNALRSMNTAQRRQILNWVHDRTGIKRQILKDQLSDQQTRWDRERIEAANDNLLAEIDAQDRVRIIYRSVNLPTILPRVETAIFEDERNDIVLSHTQGLVTVARKRATTVREVVQEQDMDGTNARLGLLINRYKQHELGIRLMASCAFLNKTDQRL